MLLLLVCLLPVNGVGVICVYIAWLLWVFTGMFGRHVGLLGIAGVLFEFAWFALLLGV